VLAGTAALLSACETTRLDAGSNDDGDAGDEQGHVLSGTPSNSYDYPCNLPAPSWLGGTWVGQFDSYALPSGSSSVRISVAGAFYSEGGLCGTITLGDGEPLPLPTDPSLPPPGVPSLVDFGEIMRDLREGFPYDFASPGPTRFEGDASFTPEPPAIEGQRLRTIFNPWQFYNAWCNMQPSYRAPASGPASSPTEYTCVPPDALSTGSDAVLCDVLGLSGITVRPGTCAQAGFCLAGLCNCFGPESVGVVVVGSVYGCGAKTLGSLARLDATVSDNTMSGSVVFDSGVEIMHLTRLSLRADCADCAP
jgi:hypothetical protein